MRRIVHLIIFIVAMALTATGAPRVTIKPEWVLIGGQPLRWKSPPRRLHAAIKTAPARVLVFYPNGDFADLRCLLLRQKNGAVTISNGDGQVVAVGNWERQGNITTVRSRVIYRTVEIAEHNMPESLEVEMFKSRLAGGLFQLVSNGKKYAALPEFSDFENLSRFAQHTAFSASPVVDTK